MLSSRARKLVNMVSSLGEGGGVEAGGGGGVLYWQTVSKPQWQIV